MNDFRIVDENSMCVICRLRGTLRDLAEWAETHGYSVTHMHFYRVYVRPLASTDR